MARRISLLRKVRWEEKLRLHTSRRLANLLDYRPTNLKAIRHISM